MVTFKTTNTQMNKKRISSLVLSFSAKWL